MALTGYWISNYGYKVMDPELGKSEVAYFAGTPDEMRDPVLLQEIEHKLRESVARSWLKPKKKPLTRDQGHDLGKILFDIQASKVHYAESLHGRFWEVTEEDLGVHHA